MKRVVPAGLAHPALLLLLLAGSVGTQATQARGSPEGWVERGGLSCSAPSASLSLCWFLFCGCFFFFFLLFLLQIKAAICCDKCSHSPFPSYLLPHREALWRLTASSSEAEVVFLYPPASSGSITSNFGMAARRKRDLACFPLHLLSCQPVQLAGISHLLRGNHLGDWEA